MPVGRSSSESLSEEEEMRGQFWLESCLSELGARFAPAPTPAVRALQIGECMQARGWRLVVRESNAAQ
jgi:hypothetical protein